MPHSGGILESDRTLPMEYRMNLFSRKKKEDDEPVDLNDRSPQLGIKYKDLLVLGNLMQQGADLTQPRHVLY